jgi:hypothetical protein
MGNPPPPRYGNKELNKRALTCTIMFCVHAYLFVCEKEGRLLCESVCVCGSSGCEATSIERFIEGQAFLRSYDLAPRPPLPPLSVSKLDRRHIGRLRKRVNLLTVEGNDGAWPSIND